MSDQVSGEPLERLELAAAPAAALPAGDRLAARLRGFGPIGLVAILIIAAGNFVVVPLSAVLVLVWARWSRTPWAEIGYVWPKSWIGDLVVGVAFGIALKLFMKTIAMPLLGADPINQAYHHLVGNSAAIPAMLYLLIVGAGFGEETFFRGFMFERLGRIFGQGVGARVVIVLLASAWFGLVHYPVQGLAGAQQATMVGLAFGTIYATKGRLWMLMCAHAAFDLTAYAIIYWDLESTVAGLVFR